MPKCITIQVNWTRFVAVYFLCKIDITNNNVSIYHCPRFIIFPLQNNNDAIAIMDCLQTWMISNIRQDRYVMIPIGILCKAVYKV